MTGPAIVGFFGIVAILVGSGLLAWALAREYRDLQRLYGLALGSAGVVCGLTCLAGGLWWRRRCGNRGT